MPDSPSHMIHGGAKYPNTGTTYIVRLTLNLRKKNTFPIPSLHRFFPHRSLSLFLSYYAKLHRGLLSLRMIESTTLTRKSDYSLLGQDFHR